MCVYVCVHSVVCVHCMCVCLCVMCVCVCVCTCVYVCVCVVCCVVGISSISLLQGFVLGVIGRDSLTLLELLNVKLYIEVCGIPIT